MSIFPDEIAFDTVIEAFRVLGIDDPDDVREVRINPRDVIVTRYHKPQGRIETDGNGAIVLAERARRIVTPAPEPELVVEDEPDQLDRDSAAPLASGSEVTTTCEPVTLTAEEQSRWHDRIERECA